MAANGSGEVSRMGIVELGLVTPLLNLAHQLIVRKDQLGMLQCWSSSKVLTWHFVEAACRLASDCC